MEHHIESTDGLDIISIINVICLKSKANIMETYKLRIDLSKVSTKVAQDYVKEHSTGRYGWCIEGGEENPHIHGYFATTCKQATLRKHLRELGLRGNGGYSLKACDYSPIEYFAYMMKEGNFHFSEVTEEEKSSAVEHNDKVVKGLKKEKEEKKTILEKIDQMLGDQPSDQDIQLAILKYHFDNRLLVRKFQCIAYFDTIKLRRYGVVRSLSLFS